MVRPPPISTRTDTLLPYATHVRSFERDAAAVAASLVRHSAASRFRPARNGPAIIPRTTGPARSRHSARSAGLEKRSEEHTSELQSLMRISYAVFCLKNKRRKLTVVVII